jgi:hypothetical protein
MSSVVGTSILLQKLEANESELFDSRISYCRLAWITANSTLHTNGAPPLGVIRISGTIRLDASRQGSRQTSNRSGYGSVPASLVKTGGRGELGSGASKQVGGIAALVLA